MRTERKRDGKRRNFWTLFIGLGLVGIAVCALFLVHAYMLRAAAKAETRNYLEEVSLRIAETVDSRIDASFRALELAAEVYPTLDEADKEAYLRVMTERHGFLRMGVTGRNGPLVTTDGDRVPLDALIGVQQVFKGTEAATDLSISPVDGAEIVVYGVPIWSGKQVAGVLTGVNAKECLQEYLGVESFGGAGFSGIITGKGDVIVTTPNRDSDAEMTENFFALAERGTASEGYSLDAMRRDMKVRRSGTLDYTLTDGNRKILCYVPLNVSDWYLLSVVSYDVVNQSAQSYTEVTEWVDLAIVAVFLSLIAVLATVFWRGQRRIERLAFVDRVTGGANRTAFERDTSVLLSAAPPGSYAAVSMDLQGFKLINESFGSEAGDRLLRHIYTTAVELLEAGELVGRTGGDVFNLLLKYTDRSTMEKRMERLGENINRFNLNRDEKERYYLPVFQGVYVVEEPDLDVITVLDRANVARKSDKRTRLGRLNTCIFYDDLYQARLHRERDLDNRAEAALKNGEFVIHLQPKVELRWNTVIGAEALVRWQDSERGLVPPDEFIPHFERSGFIVKLDRYVFRQVCALQRAWLDGGHKPVVVSLNVSRNSVADPSFIDEYVRIKEEYRIPDGLLELELTETMITENEQMLLTLMERVRESGFVCSLDDFGSGYSTLSLLRVLPVDVIKLDKVFFADSEKNQRSEYIIQSVLEMAHRLKMQTVCEGVERIGQLHLLQRFRCDAVQGFVFSGPVCVEEFEALAFAGRPLTPTEWKEE